jgi:hypothetical protein
MHLICRESVKPQMIISCLETSVCHRECYGVVFRMYTFMNTEDKGNLDLEAWLLRCVTVPLSLHLQICLDQL